MNYRNRGRGSVVLLILGTIAVVSMMGAAMVSLSGTSLQSQLNTGNSLRAHYLAESGARFADRRPRPGNFFTVWSEDGVLRFALDDPPPAEPTPIPTSGFRVVRTGCKLESIGIVRANTVFEAAHRIVGRFSNGMPCWRFDDPPTGNSFDDSCGASLGVAPGTGWEWRTCDGRPDGSLSLDGTGYMATDFHPFCEIGDGAPFTVRFWARPVDGFGGAVLGVDDGFNRFSVGVDAVGAWTWAYGNRTGGGIPADPNVWQRVTFLYDPAFGEVRLQVVSCPSGVRVRSESYDGSAVIPEPAGTDGLFAGAENRNGTAVDFFTGALDEIDIVNAVELPDAPSLFCPGLDAVAYYPLDRDTLDRSGPFGAGNGHDAAPFGGTTTAADRNGCPEGAYEFDGAGGLRVADADALDLLESGTLAAWIRPNSFPESAGLIHKGDLSSFLDESYTLHFGDSVPGISPRRLRVALTDETGQVFFADSASLFSGNTWVHVAATWNIAGISPELVLYVDGVPEARTSLASMSTLRNSDGDLHIGARLPASEPSNFPFDGSMDDILIYARSLAEEAIAFLAADGAPTPAETP